VSAPAAGQGTKIVNLDDRVTFKQQLEHNTGPVVLMRAAARRTPIHCS